MLMRRSDMASLIRRRGDLTPEAKNFEEEQSDPVRTLAQLRRLGVGLVTVSHANLVGLIRIPRPSTHPLNATEERFVTHLSGSLQGAPERRHRELSYSETAGSSCAITSLSERPKSPERRRL
jgi:hypothetical protein